MEKKTKTTIIGLGFRRNGKENRNYCNGLDRDYYKDPFLHSQLTKGKEKEQH